jgi:predicted RND superfamily exporter protein
MIRIANALTFNKISFFSLSTVSVFLSLIFIPLPEFTGDISGFKIDNNRHFEAFNKADKIFKHNSKVYLHIYPKSNNLSAVKELIHEISNQIKTDFQEVSLISPLEFHKKMSQHWKIKNNSLSAFLDQASNVPVIGQLISKDKKSFLLVASFPSKDSIDASYFNKFEILKHQEIKSINTFSISHVEASIEDYIRKDLLVLTFLIIFFFIIYILLVYRTINALIFTGFIILIPIAASLSLFYFFGLKMNLISILVIPILLILALSDALHLMAGYIKFKDVANKNDRVNKVISHYLIPSFFSSATTAAAFFSFYCFNDSKYIQEFGLITSIALMIEFFITFLIAPFLLYFISPNMVYDRFVNSISFFLLRHKKAFSYASFLILIISGFLISKIVIKSDTEIFFPQNSKIRNIHESFKESFYSSINLNILIKSDNSVSRESTNNFIKKLVKKLKSERVITGVISSTDQYFFKSKIGIPVNLFKNLGENNPYYNAKLNIHRIELHFTNGNKVVEFSKNRLNEIISKPPDGINISTVSSAILMDEVNSSVSKSLVQSLSSSGLVIFLMIFLLTRSISASILSLLPNLVPIAFIAILFYVFGISLNIITSLTAVICLGLLDDDTVHILYRKLLLKEEMEELSFSILSSGIILSFCFSLFLISSFKPIQMFGWISALIFIIGVICEFTLMQWIIAIISKRITK